MSYQPPVQDLMFCIEHLSHWDKVSKLSAHTDTELPDIAAALEGFAQFCAEQIAPLSYVGDAQSAHFDKGRVTLPKGHAQAYAQFVEMGWQALPHLVDYGGVGLPRAAGAAAVEMLNAADMSFGLCPLLTDGAIEALLLTGSDEQRSTYLGPLISGRWSGTMNLTEPQAGSDLGRVATKAMRREDGSYGITGTKIYCARSLLHCMRKVLTAVTSTTLDLVHRVIGFGYQIICSDTILWKHRNTDTRTAIDLSIHNDIRLTNLYQQFLCNIDGKS